MLTDTLTVWIVDDDESVRWVLEQALKQAGMNTRTFDRGEALLDALEEDQPDTLITDIRMPGINGLQLLDRVTTRLPSLPIIVVTAHSDLDSAVQAYQGGAFEYLPKPFDVDEAVALVHKSTRQRGPAVTAESGGMSTLPSLIGQAPAMQEVFRSIGRLARSSMTVLITGESGTGKELVARALHQHGPRADKPFVALNTAAIAADLLESELFGHEKGSFTGAESRRIGRFEQADTGTLFLDEVGDMSPALQTRLLRVLAESEFYRVGGQEAITVDVRVIAATNQDLAAAVSDGRFREDLYHRLNVMRINTPPLRQRREDIPLLLNHYLATAGDEIGTSAKQLSSEALELLQSYEWPGNVRQLVNATRRLSVTAPGSVITAQDVPGDLSGVAASRHDPGWTESLAYWAARSLADDQGEPLVDRALPALEKTLIRVALEKAGGHRQKAARMLGWGRNTLSRKIRQLGLDRP